jgi:uncharacterized protein involved in exopolysaccharide biosynthesis
VGLLERLAEIGKLLLTTETQISHLSETLGDLRQEVRQLAADVKDVRERLVKLETAREADRAQLRAEVSRFKAEVERAELRLTSLRAPSDEPPSLPEAKG